MHTEIAAIDGLVPKDYSEANLETLEGLVTRYREFLQKVATSEYGCEYYTDRLQVIEDALRDARYGNSEKQRARGYYEAADNLHEDLEEFSLQFSFPI